MINKMNEPSIVNLLVLILIDHDSEKPRPDKFKIKWFQIIAGNIPKFFHS